jgi:hypothetical protein
MQASGLVDSEEPVTEHFETVWVAGWRIRRFKQR